MTHGVDLCNSLPYLRLFCYPDHFITCTSDRDKLGMLNVNLPCSSDCFSYSSLLLALLTLCVSSLLDYLVEDYLKETHAAL